MKVNGVAPTLSFIWVGDVTCLSANINAANGPNFCGVIGNTMDPSKRGLVRVNGFDGCHGDSGGGWYWLTSSGRRIAYGMHSRSDEGCHGDQGGNRSWFSALPLVKAFMIPDAERRDPPLNTSIGNSSHRPSASNSCGRPSRIATASSVLTQAQPGDERRAEPVHVDDVADPLQRRGLVAHLRRRPPAARRAAPSDARAAIAASMLLRSSGVTAANPSARASDSRRSTAGFAPRPITTGSFARRAKPTFSPSASVSTATTGTPHARSSRHSRSPTWPRPTTTT